MNKSHPGFKPLLPKETFHKKIGNRHIITHPEKPNWCVINNTGWEILKLFDGKKLLSDIAAIISTRYHINQQTALADLHTFFASISKSGILYSESDEKKTHSIQLGSVFLHLTSKCNLQCVHCYTNNLSGNGSEITDNEIAQFLKRYYQIGGNGLILSGGEPLMRKNLETIFTINRNANIRLLTNGTLINNAFADFLKNFSHIIIQVSIDGSNATVHDSIRGKGSFLRAMEGVEKLKKRGLGEKIVFCTTIMEQNFADLRNICALAQRTGIPQQRFLPLRRAGRAKDNWGGINGKITRKKYENFFIYIFEEAKRDFPGLEISSGLSGFILDREKLKSSNFWCPIGKNLVVDPVGNVYPCVMFMRDQFKLGNIKRNTIEEMRNSRVLASLVQTLGKRKETISKCRECMWKNFCQGGCMGLPFEQKGSVWETDEFCRLRKNFYERTVLQMAEKKSTAAHDRTDTECF